VCAVLEAHPDGTPALGPRLEACGFESPTVRRPPMLTVCPLCGGAVRWQGFNGRCWRALWERQKAEKAAAPTTRNHKDTSGIASTA